VGLQRHKHARMTSPDFNSGPADEKHAETANWLGYLRATLERGSLNGSTEHCRQRGGAPSLKTNQRASMGLREGRGASRGFRDRVAQEPS